jgi:hypothetical protein
MHGFSAMRKFLIKAIFFVISLSLTFNVLGTVADRTAPLDDWRAEQDAHAATLETRKDQIEAVTLGNSHSDAIDYSVLGVEGQSLAFAAADLFEIEKYAGVLVDQLPNLKSVFITISYYSFSRDNATFEPFRTRRIGFYSIVPVWSPIAGDAPNFLLGRLDSFTHILSVVRSDNWQGVWTQLNKDTSSEDLFPYDGVHTTSVWGECSHYTAEQLEIHAREIAGRNVSSSSQMAASHPGLKQDAFAALAGAIEGLQSNGIRVVLFTPTYYVRYTEYFAENGSDMIDDMQDQVNQLQKTYQVEYYDFSNDPDIKDQPELFYNSDHLSECGHEVLTAKLLEAMHGYSE